MGFNMSIGNKKVGLIGIPDDAKKESHARWLPPGVLFCTHCGEKYEMSLPAPVSLVEAMLLAFNKDHKKCGLDKSRGVACTFCFDFGHNYLECPTLEYDGDPMKWRYGPDTGTSSITIWEKLSLGFVSSEPQTPRDPSDFGRCYRLLKAFPLWRARIVEMYDVTGWRGLVDAWAELESIYKEELPSGTCPKLYERMQDILGRGC